MVDPGVIAGAGMVLASVCATAFAAMYAAVMVRTWRSAAAPAVAHPYEHVATALAGLVAAVTAMAFNERLPADPTAPVRAATAELPPRPPSAEGTAAAAAAVERAFAPTGWKQRVALGYVVAYFACGLGALVTWVVRPNTPNMVKHLALICLGLLLAISRTALNVPA